MLALMHTGVDVELAEIFQISADHYYTPSWLLERLGLLGRSETLRPIAGERAGLFETGRELCA
jgi:hypothetical protein